ncbi:dicarboxylate/amino acid:cation symporter [Paraburkholderia rhynchosiae]|uniref:C4-dicarboxylate transport protein n=1 Tax=Paraburkholderia rhynchosiae TaxID=487049 RepID=A0A2N7VV90_9BURK|nr:dicarboxylate/amino acid:cation symporter [Paraburkholderia rhynchosiae]PMS21075.1 C4-dicarboxylate transporter DctA [Paraburkholderia rhynchosiae]CAB3742167.1 C4-dicarboxylate transport protein [Paraburkholderia rhynchosiae]
MQQPTVRTPFYRILYVQVVCAIVLGIVFGHLWPTLAEGAKPLGDMFVRLIRMIIAPVIFCTVVGGIASMRDMKAVGRVGGKAMLYFEVVSTFALAAGLIAGHLLEPGAGFNVSVASLDASAVSGYVSKAAHGEGLMGFLMHVIPETFLGAFTQGDILPVLFIAVLFGSALSLLGERAKPMNDLIESATAAMFRVVGIITRIAPIGAFGAMAFTVGKYGIVSLLPMLKLIATFYLTAGFFVLVVLGTVARLMGFGILRFLVFIKEELLIVLGTSTSESALPQLMRKLEALGCARAVVGLVVPTGYSFNLDGTNIYMTLAVLFLAQATNTHVTLTQEITLLAVTMLTSKGATAVVGAGFVALAASLSVVPTVPVAAMVLILGIDRFMAECRALTNIIGNGVATIVVCAWEGQLDRTRLKDVLENRGARYLDEIRLTESSTASVDDNKPAFTQMR